MGWLFFCVLGGTAFAALMLLGVKRALWSMIGSALMLAGVGYAVQGSPTLGASPATPTVEPAATDPGLIDLRDRMLGRFTGDGAYLVAGDAMARVGDERSAILVILAGIHKIPNSLLLWVGLGNALVSHDGTQVSPPALFAFQQAARISPKHPAPPFFLGQAYVESGDFARARRYWARALALAPQGASYRPDIEMRLAILDRFLRLQDEAATRGSTP
ncbi:MAG: tetratricopeptide repeat protein [Pseudomonadota bacterium]|nr:tetratricopeptide repeat protein [Pseudomonadota bacterium]